MKIVELGDYSMVIMKDSEDSPWFSIGKIYRQSQRSKGHPLLVRSRNDGMDALATSDWIKSSESIYSAGRLVLYFPDSIANVFNIGDKVELDF